MKNLIFVVLLVVVAIAGYTIVNKSNENAETIATSVAPSTVKNKMTSQTNDEATATKTDDQEENLITPSDMSENAKKEMFSKIFDYQKCMLKQRLEYAKEHVKMSDMVNKTISACEPHLDELTTVLTNNHVNEGLSKKMVHTMRSKAVRKLMSNMMTSMAAQAAAASGAPIGPVKVPAAPAPVTKP